MIHRAVQLKLATRVHEVTALVPAPAPSFPFSLQPESVASCVHQADPFPTPISTTHDNLLSTLCSYPAQGPCLPEQRGRWTQEQ